MVEFQRVGDHGAKGEKEERREKGRKGEDRKKGAWLAKNSDIVAASEPEARDFSQYTLPQNKPRSAILTREVDSRAGFEEARHILCTSFAYMPEW